MSQLPLPCLPHSRTGSFSSRRIPDPQPKIQEEHEASEYIDLDTTQAQILVPISPQINEAPQPPESQPMWFTAPIDRGHQGRTSTGTCIRSMPKIVPELADIMSSGSNPYVFRTSTTAPTPLMLNTGNKTRCSVLIINSSQSEATDSPGIPPTWPTTPTSHTNHHSILQGLLLLLKDHNSTEIQSLQIKLNESFRNRPVNAETLTIAMDLIIAILHEENLQHLFTKKPNCITVMQRKLDLGPWPEALELYRERGRHDLNDNSSITVWYPYPLAALAKEKHGAIRETMKEHALEAQRKWRTPYTNILQIYPSERIGLE